MSYHSYSIHGYGICDADNACKITKERVEELLELSTDVSKYFHDNFGDDYTIEDLDDYESIETCECGVFALLCDVMNDADEGVRFISCSDYYNDHYILYEPTFPWYMSDIERNMQSSSIIAGMFARYAMILFGETPVVEFYTCENGG